jgi:hypothetical protein
MNDNLANLLAGANEYSDLVKEEVASLLCAAGLWDRITDWHFVEADRSLVVTLAPKVTPDFTPESLQMLSDAGFNYLHIPDYGPLSSFCLINPKAEA